MKDLGKYKTGASCLYVKKLSDIDIDKLKILIEKSVATFSLYGPSWVRHFYTLRYFCRRSIEALVTQDQPETTKNRSQEYSILAIDKEPKGKSYLLIQGK
jgi:hypothetical protein